MKADVRGTLGFRQLTVVLYNSLRLLERTEKLERGDSRSRRPGDVGGLWTGNRQFCTTLS